MSAIGGKADIKPGLTMSANDPKRTSATYIEPASSMLSSIRMMPCPWTGGGHEAARVHHASRQRGSDAVCGACAGADASDQQRADEVIE